MSAQSRPAWPDRENRIDQLEKALLAAGASCQGGNSWSGRLIAEAFHITSPLSMPALERVALERGYDIAEIWPWLWMRKGDEFVPVPQFNHGQRPGQDYPSGE